MELYRKITDKIKKWYFDENKALLIKGARQVGKTHAIRKTLDDIGCNYIEINLIDSPQAIDVLRNAANIDELIMGLSILTEKPIKKGNTVIFIDEAQIYKEFVSRIKFLVEEGSFRYILSGSLLGVEITNLDSAPVGYLSTLEMYPLDFEEFTQIAGITDDVIKHVKDSLCDRVPVMDVINEKLMSLFRQYLVVGFLTRESDMEIPIEHITF